MQESQEKNDNWVPKIIKIFSNTNQGSESAMEVDEETVASKKIFGKKVFTEGIFFVFILVHYNYF